MRPGLFAHMVAQHEGAARAGGESKCFHAAPVCVRPDAYGGGMERTKHMRASRFYISVMVMAVLAGLGLVAACLQAFTLAVVAAAMLVPAFATAAVLYARC